MIVGIEIILATSAEKVEMIELLISDLVEYYNNYIN